MQKKKLQVFVSSTYIDLIFERQAAVLAILSAGHIPAGMELFTAGDKSQLKVIKEWISESDIYLLILGGRYGSIEKESGKSYIQLEYEYALKLQKPLFSIVITEKALDSKVKKNGAKVIETDNKQKFLQFKEGIMSKMVKFWSDEKDIRLAIYETLHNFSKREDLEGWIPGNQGMKGPELAEEIARLTKENSKLRKELENLKSDNGLELNGVSIEMMIKLIKQETIQTKDLESLLKILPPQQLTNNKSFNNLFDVFNFFFTWTGSVILNRAFSKLEIYGLLEIIGKEKDFYESYVKLKPTESGRLLFMNTKLKDLQKNE